MGIDMYTKFKLAVDLKDNIEKGLSPATIGEWAHAVYLKSCESDISDESLDALLLDLNHMSNGPEFELSNDKLVEIANLLIEGKRIDMDKY